METGACFDASGLYRYSLWRVWNRHTPKLVFIMLNPSTADAEINDPTIRRCIGFAQVWGYGRLEVVNLFGLRTPDPHRLRQAPDPVGDQCDAYIQTAAQQADRIILAWGNWGNFCGRDQTVLSLLTSYKLFCLGRNQSGQPRHPLYLKRDVEPIPYAACRPNTQSRIKELT
jgi:hypothetical protein